MNYPGVGAAFLEINNPPECSGERNVESLFGNRITKV